MANQRTYWPYGARSESGAAMVFELVGNEWRLIASNPDHYALESIQAIRNIQRRG